MKLFDIDPQCRSMALMLLCLAGCADEVADCDTPPPSDGRHAISVMANPYGRYFCAVYEGGGVRCWGDNAGQMGGYPGTVERVPHVVNGLGCAEELALGSSTACERLTSGRVRCQGDDTFGMVGNGRDPASATPERVVGLLDAEKLDCAPETGFAVLRSNGSLWQWGRGEDGTDALAPEPIVGFEGPFADLSVGGYATCGHRSDGTLKCARTVERDGAWSDGAIEVLGHTVVRGRVQTGVGFACVVDAGRSVLCWGRNDDGQLGDGTLVKRDLPGRVAGLSNVSSVAVGAGHACAIDGHGTVHCWGITLCTLNPHPSPSVVALPHPALQVATSYLTTCALLDSYEIWCWGSGLSYELGIHDGVACREEPGPVDW